MNTLLRSIDEATQGTFDVFDFAYQVEDELRRIWPPEPRVQVVEARSAESFDLDVCFSLAEPEPTTWSAWSVAFTPTFRKSVAGVDKKLQGRVLVAIAELSETPNTVHGDTMRPLVGEFKGLWRYRVGDYRLVYEPRQENRLVILLEFAARGGAYER